MKLKIKTSFLLLILTFGVQGFCCDCNPPCLGCAVCQGGICVASDYFCYYFSSICEECIMKSETEGECMCFEECCEDSDCTGECHNGCGVDCKCIDDDDKCDPGETCCKGNCCEEGEICCGDGSCAWPCIESEKLEWCTGPVIDCPECYNLPWQCNNNKKWVRTGNKVYECSGGCPGDCDSVDDVHCWTSFYCIDEPDYLAMCSTEQVEPGVWEWKCVAGAPWNCYECIRDPTDPGEKGHVGSERCQ